MLKKLGILSTLLALFTALQMHLLVVQVIAWQTMLIDHSQQGNSFAKAVDVTFGGEQPCNLCKFVTEQSSQEENKTVAISILKEIKLLVPSKLAINAYRAFKSKFSVFPGIFCVSPFFEPPVPPPKF